jgi:ABC-type Na+ efflux pump permease subunit
MRGAEAKHEEHRMKTLTSILTLVVAAYAGPAAAANATCEAAAKEKKLAGAALTSFMKKCEADAAGAQTCETLAAEKKLAGAAKTSFVTKCEKDGGKSASAAAACESQADDKKLAGAARNSFVKKCVTDAGG